MDKNTIDIDDESSECEELILKSRIISYESENDDFDYQEQEKELIDNFDEEMIILEISLSSEDFNLLKDNKIIIGEGDECILILNDLIKLSKEKSNNKNLSTENKNKMILLYGFILGLIYSKYNKKK
jgi:hypothetical protein